MEKKPLLHDDGKEWRPKHFLSVEPSLLIFSAAIIMSGTIFQNYLLFRTCEEYNFEESICETELDSQKTVSQLMMFKTFFVIFLWILTTNFAGSLIDRNLKYLRLFLLLPAFGQSMIDILNVLSVFYFKWPPFVLMIYTLFLSGFTGGQVTALLISITYVSHESTRKYRSIKIGHVVFAQAFGQALGNVSGGYVIDLLGFGNGFLLCVGLNGFSLLLGWICIENLNKRGIHAEGTSAGNFLGAATEGLKVMIRRRLYNKRRMLILLLVVFTLTHCNEIGVQSNLYLFLRNKFGWEAAQYGVFMFYMMCTKGLGTLTSTEILKKRLRLHDTTVGIIASCLDVVSDSLWLLIFQSWHVYLIPLFGIFGSVVQLITMSLATKCVEPEEFGRLSSLFALSKLFLPVASLFSDLVYQNTLSTFPAAIFVVSVFLSACILVIFGILSLYMRLLPVVELPPLQ